MGGSRRYHCSWPVMEGNVADSWPVMYPAGKPGTVRSNSSQGDHAPALDSHRCLNSSVSPGCVKDASLCWRLCGGAGRGGGMAG